ncbi:hypothetical protein [Hominifimenecus sp. rT4P-3]|uniref:hypothetical protein n=1 Tax=Hominifimenecus sp. rT4P-3 TaxID=3242979 RepID=UPI003DA4BAB9
MAAEQEITIDLGEEEIAAEEENDRKEYKVNLPVSKVNAMAQTFLGYIYRMDDEEARQDLYELMERFIGQEQQSGSADDFHNFAVELARKDEYGLACQVLECGLKLFPKNVDLLSDYLQYGISCDKGEECKKYYKRLLKIPKRRWTWRGFAFLVDYLQYIIDRSDSEKEMDAKEQEMLQIVADFRKHFPYSEESYRTEANVYRVLNMPDQELEILKAALDQVQVAPKCALRYADILFERGRYSEAAEAIKRGISDATQTQSSVNEGYIYYLSALCKIAIAQKQGAPMDEVAANEIYSDFNIALNKFRDTRSGYSEVIRTKTNTMINKTGVEVDAKYDLLCECIAG